MPAPILSTARPQVKAAAAPPPVPGIVETIGAGFRTSADETTFVQESRLNRAYAPVVQALAELNGTSVGSYGSTFGHEMWDYRRIWAGIEAARVRDPNAFKDIGSRQDFERKVVRRGDERSADQDVLARGNGVSGFVGSVAGSFADPTNVAMGIVGGGPAGAGLRALGRQVLIEGGINAATEAGQLALGDAEAMERLGEPLDAAGVATRVGTAGAFGAAFPIAGRVASVGTGAARGQFERAVTANWDRIPQGLRDRWSARAKLPDEAAEDLLVTDLVEAMVGRDRMTEAEGDAVNVLRRGAEVEQANPYVATGAGVSKHNARLDAALATLTDPPASRPAALRASTAVRPQDAALAQPVAFDRAWDAIIGIEGGSNRDGSFRTSPAGAIGPAQVMPGTAPYAARLAGIPWDERRYRTDAAYNIALGRAYYREMLRQFDGDQVKAAAAYNAGPGSAVKGTGVRGAMARAERAGRPGDWVEFLPRETRGYVRNFRRRTGAEAGDAIRVAGDDAARALDDEGAGIAAEQRAAALDRAGGDRAELELPEFAPLPELRRDLFADDTSWRVAQSALDADAVGAAPVITRQSVWDDAVQDMRLEGGDASAALWQESAGPIDVRWGDSTGGLAAIEEASPGVTARLPAMLAEMEVAKETPRQMVLQNADGTATVRLQRAEPDQPWQLASVKETKPKAVPAARKALANAAPRADGDAVGGKVPAGRIAADPSRTADTATLAAFDDPAGEGAKLTSDSDWHDIEAALEAEQLGGMTVDLDDGQGDRPLGKLIEDIKKDEVFAAALRGCL